MWRSIDESGQWRGEIWNRRKDVSVFPEWVNISVVRNDDGVLTNYVAVFSDLSSLKSSEEKMERPLTAMESEAKAVSPR
ncbi:MAG: hypothetical protein G8D28_03235 [gamma proteobacterium symbiont of Phacoides pectinatus]